MQKNFRYFLLLFVSLFLVNASYGWQLRGTIVDEKGEPMPYVSVYIENTTYGVASNPKGQYFLELDDGDYKVVFQTVGYDKQVVPITIAGKSRVQDVTMSAGIDLAEVTINADAKDPAYAIIKQAIKARKKYLKQWEAYSCNTYIKASLDKESRKKKDLIDSTGAEVAPTRERMNFVESYGTTHFEQPNKVKEIKSAYNDLSEKVNNTVTVNIDFGDGDGPPIGDKINPFLYYLTISDGDFNFYQNSLNIPRLSETPLVSPIGSGALLSYKYELIESFYEDGETELTNKIKVTPRFKEGALFSGHIYIMENTWNIKAVDLEVNSPTLYFFKDFRVIQNYELINDSVWVPSREEFFYNARDGKRLMIGNTLAIHSEYQINPKFPKRFFQNELKRVEDDAFEKDTTFWDGIRPITLKPEEMLFVRKQDSIRTYENSEEFKFKQDSIVNAIDIWDILFNGIGHRNTFKGTELYFEGIVFSARPLMVGGYHHSITGSYNKEWDRATKLETDFSVMYGFKNSDVTGEAEVAYMYNPKKFAKFYVSGGRVYDFINNYESIEAIFSRSNYVLADHYGFGHRMELLNGLYLNAGLAYRYQRSITGLELADWSNDLFGSNNAPLDFDPYRQLIFEGTLTYTPQQKYYTEPYKKVIIGSKYPKFQLKYRKGIKNALGSQVDFDFLELNITQSIQLGTLGESKYAVTMGRFLNDNSVRFIEHKWFRGSDQIFYSDPLRSFQLLGPSINTPEAFFQAHYIHHFNGALMNKIPLVNKLKVQAVGGAGILLIEENNFRHAEAYVGLEKPFKIRKQLMKFGLYAVAADSNHPGAEPSLRLKIGFDFFNTFTNSWSY